MSDDPIFDPAFVAALFDRCSARYRWWSAAASFGMVAVWRRQCVNRLLGQRHIARLRDGTMQGPGPKAAPQVADLMAGSGEVWAGLLRAIPRAQIAAIDISPGMHAAALSRLAPAQARQISHQTADILGLSLAADSADLVISTFGLKTFDPQQQRILARQITHILRPGGSFALIEASDPRGWLLRPLYRFYLDRILPLIERLFLRGAQDFAMLGAYTRAFRDCAGFAQALRDEGLIVGEMRHFFGCATSVAGTKPVAPQTHSA